MTFFEGWVINPLKHLGVAFGLYTPPAATTNPINPNIVIAPPETNSQKIDSLMWNVGKIVLIVLGVGFIVKWAKNYLKF